MIWLEILKGLHTNTLDPVVIIVISLVASAAVSADSIPASAILTHSGKICAFIDILSVHVAQTSGTELVEGRRSLSGTRLTSISPCFPNLRATAETFVEQSVDHVNTFAVFVASVALLLADVQTFRSCKVLIKFSSYKTIIYMRFRIL